MDIMIANPSGEGVAIQVKTSNGARREYKRNPANNRWEFDVGHKARTLVGPRLFYIFVDLNWGHGTPNVFIVPSDHVQKRFAGTNFARNMFWLMDNKKDEYLERWDYIEATLTHGQ